MTFRAAAPIVVTVVLMLAGCGYDTEPLDAFGNRVVTLASDSDIAVGNVLPASYLVAFKSSPKTGASSYMAEYQHHYMPLADRQRGDSRVKELYFLTDVDLRTESASGDDSIFDNVTGANGLIGLPPQLLQKEPMTAAITRVDFQSPEAASSALREWESQGLIYYAEPNYVSRLHQDPAENIFAAHAKTYDDLNYWWLETINLPQTFAAISKRDQTQPGVPTDLAMQGAAPIIAVLDSGVDYAHPALAASIWVNQDENTSGCTGDKNGCNTTTAVRGKLGNGDVYPFDTDGPGQSCFGKDSNCSHGTHVAGIITGDAKWADPETGQPANGVCPICRIMILKIVSRVGKESGILDSAIIAAFKYVALRKENSAPVRVINASFGKFVRSRSVGLLVRLLREKSGTLVVAAAGNEDTLTMEYPAAFKDAVAVAAIDSRLLKVSFSNFGRWVDVAAPGNNIVSTVPGNALDSKSGTSMAAPMVAGVAGLMLARYPDIGFGELRKWLLESADARFYDKNFAGGVNNYAYYKIPKISEPQPLLGYGVLNALGAVNKTPAAGLPVYTALDRVTNGCGVIDWDERQSGSGWTLLLPLLFIICMSAWRYYGNAGFHRYVYPRINRRETDRSR